MKTIYILGTGCQRCRTLADNAEQAARQLGIDFEIVKVTDVDEIIDFGVMMTPALAIDDEVKVVGKVASVGEIKELLT